MPRYRFLTTWLLDAPLEEVFEAVHDSESWPQWWRGVESVLKLSQGDGDGEGSVGWYRWRSAIPYAVTFELHVTRVERPWLVEGRARGSVEGIGRWRLYEARDETTAVVYEWDVEVRKLWMRASSPLLGPLFRWNHDVIMRWGGEGLARHLGTRLVAAGTRR